MHIRLESLKLAILSRLVCFVNFSGLISCTISYMIQAMVRQSALSKVATSGIFNKSTLNQQVNVSVFLYMCLMCILVVLKLFSSDDLVAYFVLISVSYRSLSICKMQYYAICMTKILELSKLPYLSMG
jgi:hypothetical protein